MKTSSRFRVLLLGSIFLVSLLLIQTPITTHAYTPCEGIQTNDVVFVQYEGSIQDTGEVFDSNDRARFIVRSSNLIQGFYEGLLGMKEGEEDTIVVPPSKGYTNPDTAPTAPSGDTLFGETLVFEVFIIEVDAAYVSDCESGTNEQKFANFLWKFLGWTAGALVIGFIGITGYYSLQKQTTPACVHCKEHGRSRLSEGKCGKCGKHYCRPSFSRGCPNCKSNSFVPNK